uniref:Uncharacterized protein n=1 Tax=Cacopsylla melanoneura TaxID=428564 RepID=A0A8D8XBW1_9HEMI
MRSGSNNEIGSDSTLLSHYYCFYKVDFRLNNNDIGSDIIRLAAQHPKGIEIGGVYPLNEKRNLPSMLSPLHHKAYGPPKLSGAGNNPLQISNTVTSKKSTFLH